MLALMIAASEPSKIPFYIAGGAFAVWAVVLAYAGLTKPAFPFHPTGQRAVMAVSFLLAVLAIGTAIATSK